jgi:hypothetical protein
MTEEASEPRVAAPSDNADPFDDLADLPLADHVARFEAYHDELRARLVGGVGSLGDPGGPGVPS